MSAAIPRRPMTFDERRFVLALDSVTMVPGSFDKCFRRVVVRQAARAEPQITEKQSVFLARLIVKYRRQLDDSVVDRARELLAPTTAIPTSTPAAAPSSQLSLIPGNDCNESDR